MDIYLVFWHENGGNFLEKVFKNPKDAQYYIEAQPVRYQKAYSLQTWEVE